MCCKLTCFAIIYLLENNRERTCKNMMFELFLTFAKIGLFTFGGGYAMISLIEDECVEKKKWITSEQLTTVTAIAESTPGPIAINCATYTGYMRAGVPGALCATLGVTLPSFMIIYLISLFFDNFLEITVVESAFKGIKIAVGILITRAAFNLWKKTKKDMQAYAILFASFTIMLLSSISAVKVSTIVLILATGVLSMLIYKIRRIAGKGGTIS